VTLARKAKESTRLQTVKLRIVNWRNVEIRFVLEPWGESYPFAPEDQFVVEFEGPPPADPEVVDEEQSVTVWGWAGSIARLLKNSVEVGNSTLARTAVPDAFPVKNHQTPR
jgi:hypothetical protein